MLEGHPAQDRDDLAQVLDRVRFEKHESATDAVEPLDHVVELRGRLTRVHGRRCRGHAPLRAGVRKYSVASPQDLDRCSPFVTDLRAFGPSNPRYLFPSMTELPGRNPVEIAVWLREAESARLLGIAQPGAAAPNPRGKPSRDRGGDGGPGRERPRGLARLLIGAARRPRPIRREPQAK